MPRVIVLGTGTNVGKTYVSRALVLALKALDPELTVAGLKPIETGISPLGAERLGPCFSPESDAHRLSAVARGVRLPSPHPLFAFPEPVSPHLAARRVGGSIELSEVVSWLASWEREALHAMSRHAWSVIESAGALFSPLSPLTTNFDLALALEPAHWILVAPDALGVLHDVRVTWEACARRGRLPDHLLLCASRPRDRSTGTNAEELRALGIAQPMQSLARDSEDLSRLARTLLDAESRSPLDATPRGRA